VRDAVARTLSFWVRGPVFERSDFAPGEGLKDRTWVDVPADMSGYFLAPLGRHATVLVEGEARFRAIDSSGPAVDPATFSRTTELGLGRAHLTMDVAGLLAPARAPERIDAARGPLLTLGRFDPSTFLSHPTNRQALHDLPGDTERSAVGSDIQRFPLVPYAMGARFFGLFDRAGDVLLPTTAALVNARANLGAGLHGRFGRRLPLYAVGFLNGAATSFPETGDTLDPYFLLRQDLGRGRASGSVSLMGSYGPGTAEVRYTDQEAADGSGGRRTLDWLRIGIASAFSYGPLDLYGSFMHDELFRVPSAISTFDETSHGLTAAADYRIHPEWLASIRYDWMDPGGFRSTLAGLGGPESGQVLHLQLRWLHIHGRSRPRSTAGLAALTLRNSINLAPGGGAHPLRAWQHTVVLGIDVSL
jgi:hypothetical protein